MKKLTYLMSIMFVTIAIMGCEKEFNGVDNPGTNVQEHTYFKNSGAGTVNQFDYSVASNLKSTDTVGDSIGFIRFTSYYSEDFGQRNIHEIEAYEDTVNVLLNDTSRLIFKSNRLPQWDYNHPNRVVDGNLTDLGRWASLRWLTPVMDTAYYVKLSSFSDSLTVLLRDNPFMLDSVINNTVYFDTVFFTINLPRLIKMDSLKLYLGEYMQIFDVEVSADTTTGWTLLEPEKYKVIK